VSLGLGLFSLFDSENEKKYGNDFLGTIIRGTQIKTLKSLDT
jgi:hypothetical protein